MSTFWIIVCVIAAIICFAPLLVDISFLFGNGTKKIKNTIDEKTGNDTGCFGWIISIVIIFAILFLLALLLKTCNVDDYSEPDYRHSNNMYTIESMYSTTYSV